MPTQLPIHDRADHYAQVVQEAAASAGSPVTCRSKGCNACCRGPLMVRDEEADAVYQALTPGQRERVSRYNLDNYTDPRWAPCPMLAPDGSCSVYDVRPAVCRMYSVSSHPTMCSSRSERAPVLRIQHPIVSRGVYGWDFQDVAVELTEALRLRAMADCGAPAREPQRGTLDALTVERALAPTPGYVRPHIGPAERLAVVADARSRLSEWEARYPEILHGANGRCLAASLAMVISALELYGLQLSVLAGSAEWVVNDLDPALGDNGFCWQFDPDDPEVSSMLMNCSLPSMHVWNVDGATGEVVDLTTDQLPRLASHVGVVYTRPPVDHLWAVPECLPPGAAYRHHIGATRIAYVFLGALVKALDLERHGCFVNHIVVMR